MHEKPHLFLTESWKSGEWRFVEACTRVEYLSLLHEELRAASGEIPSSSFLGLG